MADMNVPVMARIRTGWIWGACAWLPFAVPSMADGTLEGGVKAGFIHHFAAFAEWPEASQSSQEIRTCALGGQPLAGQRSLLQERQIHSRTIRVSASARTEEWQSCQILCVSDAANDRLDSVLKSLGNAPVLTVSDIQDLVHAGGMIGLNQLSGRLCFDINLGAARRAGLVLSSRLLSLADEVLQ